jgi:SOS-response transcriptional repressor LexA
MFLMPSLPHNPIHLLRNDTLEPSEASLVIRRRMKDVGLSQKRLGQLVGKSQAWVSQELLSDTPQVVKRLWVNEPYTFTQLAKSLEWSDHELVEATGVAVPVHQPAILATETAFLDRYGDLAELTVRLPLYGSLAAGIEGFEFHKEAEEFIDYDRRELPKGIDVAKLYVVRANGNSMYEENMTRPVPDGSMLLVEGKALPVDRQVVVAYIPELEIGVVKQFRNMPDDVLLKSYRQGGPVFWASQYPEMRVEGVVRRVTYEMW